MARPVTMFTGQWADLPLEELCRKFSEFGFDGLELACWGDHFEVDKALSDDDYCSRKRALLDKYGLQVWAISAHLVGQAVLDNIDQRRPLRRRLRHLRSRFDCHSVSHLPGLRRRLTSSSSSPYCSSCRRIIWPSANASRLAE